MEKYAPGTWKYLVYKNWDLLVSLFITLVLGVVSFLIGIKIEPDYAIFIYVFLGIFTVNLTVFALSKFLVENYSRIKESRTKETIDAIFRTPIKTAMIGMILSFTLILFNSHISWIYFILLFLLFYSIISSYCVFLFIYRISVKRNNKNNSDMHNNN